MDLTDSLSKQHEETEFINVLINDLESFEARLSENKLLLLPPFNNYHRFLTHQLIQTSFPQLKSFSVGDTYNRRLFVCSKNLKFKNKNNDQLKMTNEKELETKSSNAKKQQSKRPSLKLYVPRARRAENPILNDNQNDETNQIETINKQQNDDSDDLANKINNINLNKENQSTHSNLNQNDVKNDEVEDSWDSIYNDDGECLDKKLLKELNNTVNATGELKIEKVMTIDYLKFTPKEVEFDDDELTHVIEIYDFPIEFKNENIYNAFRDFMKNDNFDIKWVDDTHCLGVFANTQAAQEALRINNFMLKTRPIAHATASSKSKAKGCIKHLKPYKPRPQTSTLVASKLIGASLGIGNILSKEKSKEEQKKIQNARMKHQEEKALKDAIWNGNV